MDYFMVMASTLNCGEQAMISVMTLIGWVVMGIKIVVPIILIIVGMLDMAKAVNEKSEDNIKKAQNALIKKAITAVIVFLVPTLVTLLMSVLGSEEWKPCFECIKSPGKPVQIDGATKTCQISL